MADDNFARGNNVVWRSRAAVAAAVLAASLGGCALIDELHEAPDDPPGSLIDAGLPDATGPGRCEPIVDRFKELLIVEPGVVGDPERTAPGGPWSFRHLIEQMKPDGVSASDFVLTWLADFNATEVNGFPVAARRGVDAFVSAWPRATDGTLDLDRAPFELTAIVNRLDLRDETRADSAGEGRLVFTALVNGAPASFTLIFEYLLPTDNGRTPEFWARTWHGLGSLAAGPGFNRTLEAVTRLFTDRDAAPSRQNGSALGQLRTNEIQFGSPWELREFRLDASGALRIAPTHRCPDQSFNGSEELARFVRDNAEAVRNARHELPESMLGGACQETTAHVWRLPGVDEPLRHAFARETCNGCHFAETASKNGFHHIAPTGTGADRLSRFLHDPTNPNRDELARRAVKLVELLCSEE